MVLPKLVGGINLALTEGISRQEKGRESHLADIKFAF
jgi:hypothetical protein